MKNYISLKNSLEFGNVYKVRPTIIGNGIFKALNSLGDAEFVAIK